MAKKTSTEKEIIKEEVAVEAPAVEAEVKEKKNPIIIANAPTAFRQKPNLEITYIIGQMPIGVAYEIVEEFTSRIYGGFYKLNNGYYITKDGNYSIN